MRKYLRRGLLIILSFLASVAMPASDADALSAYPQIQDLFPQANKFGAFEGAPRAVPVYRNEQLLGYAFLTADMVRIPAYSGRPINVLVGIDMSGRITGARIIHHAEPILQAGIPEQRIHEFVDQFRGKSTAGHISVGGKREGYETVDAISGATITLMVLNSTIARSVRMVAESRGITPATIQEPAAQAAQTQPEKTTSVVSPPKRKAGAAANKNRVSPAPIPHAPTSPAVPSKTPMAATETPPLFATTIDDDEEPMWVTVWRQRTFEISALLIGLTLLTGILLFQDYLARHPYLLQRVRTGFLLYTLFFIGWYAHGQLSIINVLTFIQAMMHQFSWNTFLIDPMLFLLWGYVAMTLLLWGRGVYCGWLCPFGALQELIFKLARLLRLPYFEMPHVIHERLLALKLLIMLGLFGISLQSMGQAIFYAEIEPFKTAISLKFQREWMYVVLALGVLMLTAFNRKFYCKYMCPLGAALVIPGRFRSFDWLRRRKECGTQCQACAAECEVQAIRPTGEINANECHYCLDCQVTYYNEKKCPPLVEKRKRRERGEQARELARKAQENQTPVTEKVIPISPVDIDQ